jgi:hypothetical protein
MLDMEQRRRLEELRAKDMLKPDEAEELAALEQLEPEDPSADEFDSAWDELDGKKPEEKPAEEDQEDQEPEEKPDESQSTEADGQDGDILNQAPADSDTTPDSSEGDATPDPRDAQIAELTDTVKQLTHNMKSWEGRLKAADKRAAEAERKLKEAEAKGQAADSDTGSPDEDDAEVSSFFKEYPDLEGPIKKVAEKIATKIVDAKVGDKIETLESAQAQQAELTQEEADRIHMEKINTAHPDWEKIFDSGALHTWIGRQPGYLQPRLNEIIKSGSAQEVIDMFDSYKRAAGKGKETTTNSTEADLKKKEKAKELEAVPASSGGPKKGQVKISKDDFDGAWENLEKKDKASGK